MLIRLGSTHAPVPRTGGNIAFIHGEVQPQASALEGNRGFAVLVDRASQRYVSVAEWTDARALAASADRAVDLIGEVSRRLGGTEPVIEVFDVALVHVVKPVRVGYWGRLTRARVPIEALDRAARKFEQTALPVFEHYDGVAVIGLFVDRERGVAHSLVCCETLHVLRESEPYTRELQGLLAPELADLEIVDAAELEVVIAERGASPMTEPGATVAAPWIGLPDPGLRAGTA